MGFILQTGVLFTILLAVGLQLVLKDPIKLGLGIGKTFQPLSDFPYSCRRIKDPSLQACEDMYLFEPTRTLFLACSDPLARQQWMPNGHHFNISGRSHRDAIIALDVDKPTGDGFQIRRLVTPGFSGTAGDGLLQLVGFTAFRAPGSQEKERAELLIVNNRPPIDPATGALLQEAHEGANATIELFENTPPSPELKHIRTIASANISTPNNIAALSSDSFYFTNDSGDKKRGLGFYLSWLLGHGDVSHCNSQGCKRVSAHHKMPNGLTYGADGHIYVPSAMAGGVQVYRVRPQDDGLEKVADIPVPYAIDNLSLDGNGDIWAAVFPRGIEIMKASEDPFNVNPKSAAVRIRKDGEGAYTWEKVIEDGEGEVLPGSTTVVHDAKTGRLFFSGVTSPFIAVCEPKQATFRRRIPAVHDLPIAEASHDTPIVVANMSLAALDGLKAAIERIILDPKYHDILAVVKGARNGAVYGTKVRFPHALVMIFLFRSGTFRQKASLVFKATRTHARNLAKFATIYKGTMYLLKHYGPTPGKEGPYDSFFAGLLGGYLVFGGRSPRTGKISSVNQQIVIYVFARVVLGLARLAVAPGKGLPVVSREDLSAKISYYAWPVFASTSWAMVMYLFRHHPADLQPSLRSSMNYIYVQSSEWDSLRNFIWHNK
ncbi:hypothetical protein CkaCkLH20_05900 [Colletotrichum karsti]|uniref:Uncharacterized protein n=1 Tax=Colletotrichum karsti TaxID=1095194 RepID=A0A9P6I3Y1_9PEZI|nr:uncharacterized protein CkaCkLH20_05900 [Colletotrichum karsti]KAF9876492.1 hypothetical protein CkaCkLH20_05900 [Colletotrichum karsti]